LTGTCDDLAIAANADKAHSFNSCFPFWIVQMQNQHKDCRSETRYSCIWTRASFCTIMHVHVSFYIYQGKLEKKKKHARSSTGSNIQKGISHAVNECTHN
jgi:hypothetical protein